MGGASWRCLVLLASACGGSAAPQVPAVRPAPRAGAADARAARALVESTLSALSSGDVAALERLAALDVVHGRLLRCDGPAPGLRPALQTAVAEVHGAKLELVAFDPAHDWVRAVAPGEHLGSCTAIQGFKLHDSTLALRVRRPGRPPRAAKIEITVVEADGAWYLRQLPHPLVRADVTEIIDGYDGFAARMCACKDKPCADQVNEDFRRWGEQMIERHADDGKPDVETVRRTTEASTRYAECYTKIVMPSQP